MRENWERSEPIVNLDLESLTELIQPIFKGQTVIAAQTTVGGLANTNYKLELSKQSQPILLRLFVRNSKNYKKEFAISQLVRGWVKVANFLYVAPSNPLTGNSYAILEWIDGVLLDSVVQSVSQEELVQIGKAVGCELAKIHCFKFERTGLFDDDLQVTRPISINSQGFLSFIHEALIDGIGYQRLGGEFTEQFWNFAQAKAYILDEINTYTPCLVHSDYGGSNILIRRTEEEWVVSGILDWEFAYSGSTLADIGHILRSPLGLMNQFEQSLIYGFVENDGFLPVNWKVMSKLLDLLAWVEFLNRPTSRVNVINSARKVISDTMNELSYL